MSTQNVSLTAPTDYATEQASIDRRRKYAEALQSQAMQPSETQTAGGWAIRTSPLAHAAKLLEAYGGKRGIDQADEQQKILAGKYQSDMASALMKSQQEMGGRLSQTIQPDPQEAQQSADYGTPNVGAANVPAVKAYSPEAMGNAAGALMAHPATQQMGMNLTQQNITQQQQMARLLASTGIGDQPTQMASQPQQQAPAGPQPTQVASLAPVAPMSPQGPVNIPQQPQQQQAPQAGGQFDNNGVPVGVARNLINLDPTGGEYTKYLRQLHEPKISTNGQVMQYQRQQDGSWSYAPGAGAIQAARDFAGAAEGVKSANTPATINFNGKQFDTTLDIANAIRSGQAPDEATAQKASDWAAQNGIPVRMRLAPGAASTPVRGEQPVSIPDGASQPAGRFGSPTQAESEYAKKDAENAAGYKNTLNDRVRQGADLNMRLSESVDALRKFRAGGGAETRAQIAQLAQGIPGISPEVVNKIAGGDLGAMQEFQKLAVQQAMEQLKQAMGGAGRIAQAEFKVFQANNPNLSTDPEAIKKIFDFNTKLYNRDMQEQEALGQYEQSGQNPANFGAYWSKELSRRGFTNPKLSAQDPAPNAVKEIVNSGAGQQRVRKYNPATGRIE